MVSVGGISRIARAAGKLIFMDEGFTKVAETTIKESVGATTWRNIPKQNWRKAPSAVWNGLKEAERATAKEPFWENLWKKQILGFPKDLKLAWNGAKGAGAWAVTKAIGGKVLQRLPLLFVALEIPNIYSAYKDKGIVGGTLELGKSAIRMAGSMAGFVAGQALIPIPFVGGLIGAFASDWLIGKVIGKSHTEKKAEEEAKQQEALAQQQAMYDTSGSDPTSAQGSLNVPPMRVPQMTLTPQQLMAMKNSLYGPAANGFMDQDFMEMSSGVGQLGTRFNMMI